ncbi:MAG: lamin tail domain-containing protein [Phaeodactylibacter sp.]|nr:lamin tail domain-containing protein [Phaeodactylibacter sp.]
MKRTLHFFLLPLLLLSCASATAQAELQITEIFSGQAGADLTADWFEVTNVGDAAWVSGTDPDLYYDDDSVDPAAAVVVQGIIDIQPGESVIVLIAASPADITIFTGVWGAVIDLAGIEAGYADGAGLGGGGDQVNIWIGDPFTSSPVASGSYPDTAPFDGQSYDVELGEFSTVGNANGAVQTIALGGDAGNVPNIGSPGNQGPVTVDPNAPIITADVASATPFLSLTPDGPSAVGADINDPTDPAAAIGIPFILDDADTPLADLTVAVSSDNQAVVPDANLALSGSDGSRLLVIAPVGVGYAAISVTVTDTDGKNDTYTIQYAASDATIDPGTTRFHYGVSDGSTAQAIDPGYMWVADDENQTIRLFDRSQSGMPLYAVDFTAALGTTNEVDIEGSLRNGNAVFWMGSHTNQDRSVIFSTEENGAGSSATLTFTGSYRSLLDDLAAWDDNNLHGMGVGHYGFASFREIEALSADPNNPGGALLGFRGPLVDGKALVLPVENFQSIVSMNPVPNSAVFGTPIELDLGGHTLRSMDCNANGCLLIAGPFGPVNDFRLYTWSGNPGDAPELRAANLDAQTNLSAFEGIVELPAGPFLGADGDATTVQLLIDTGTFDYYNDGSEAKDLPNPQWKKFRSELVTLGPVEVPPIANPGDVVINEIMQNPAAVADADGEWFELYNTTLGSIDLNGWSISDAGTDLHVIDNGGPLLIPAGGYLVLGNNGDPAANGGVAVDYAYSSGTFNLANGADEIILTAPDLVEVDRVEWDDGATFPDPTGASMALQLTNLDNNDGANWCEAMTPYGAGDLGTPGAVNDCVPPPSFDLQITEIWVGQDGGDLTADWFEITNFGQTAWVSGIDGGLYFDDDSQDPAVAAPINGITDIQPGESVIVVSDIEAGVNTFFTVWSPDYDLDGVEIGWADGPGLGQGGDAVTLFVGVPMVTNIVDYEVVPASPSGLSYDVVLGAFSQAGTGIVQTGTNIAVATTATAGTSGQEPAIGSPGNQGPLVVPEYDLQITEIFAGQAGADLTADWFEIRNVGTAPWVSGVDPDLYFDDDSADPASAALVQGITEILPGASAIVLSTGNPADVTTFVDVWSPVIDLTGVEIGYADGAGLSGGGDAVTLWVGDPTASDPVDMEAYPDTAPFDGQSYDSDLGAFSVVGNANGAVQTIALGGDNMDVPNIGSPGDGLAVPPSTGLAITEIFSGQEGADLTADWFEIRNTGTQAWVSGVDPDLYYDDDSADPANAVLVQGIAEIQPGASAIVLITADLADITVFTDVWSPVIDLTGVEIGYADGAGLGGGGDAVTLWLGDPAASLPIAMEAYPDTAPFDGQSYDSDLGAFSVVGNANGAVQTIALGGDNMDIPNIGSPGDGLAVPPSTGLAITEIFSGQAGADLTADWFEIRNTGTQAWVSGVDPDLYYDDDSADPVNAVLVQGIAEIQPGASAIVLITADVADITAFTDVWSPVIDLAGVEIGYADGAGLGGGGDAVTLWLDDPAAFLPIAMEAYPDTAPFDGQSYDSDLGEFSIVDNANGAVQTVALGGDNGDVPNIGSPGDQGPISSTTNREAGSIKIFPNPSRGLISVQPKGISVVESVEVFSLEGQSLLRLAEVRTGAFTLDLSTLPASVYYIQVRGERAVITERIVKQ